MRPLRLELEAFGSFAGTEVVDLEALGELGLFLVTGPTGSGKTTIFDAMVFALYGTVPGSRRAEDVHSQHAPPGSVPRVALEFDAGGERWRVERTARHERPVRRGRGTTTELPTAALARWRDGAWQRQLAGVRDVTDAVVEHIGLTAEQFQRVVLLPQGEFEQFLVSRSDDRKVLLRQLFGSEVYERTVDHLRTASLTARAAADRAGAQVQHQREVLQHHLAESEGLTGARPDTGEPDPVRLQRIEAALVHAAEHRQRAEAIATQAERDLEAARGIERRWHQREARRLARTELLAGADDVQHARERLDGARRSRPVREALEPLERFVAAQRTALVARQRSSDVLAEHLSHLVSSTLGTLDEPSVAVDDLPAVRRFAHRVDLAARSAIDTHGRAREAAALADAAESAAVASHEQEAALQRRVDELDVELRELERATHRCREAIEALGDVAREAEALAARCEQRSRLDDVDQRLTRAIHAAATAESAHAAGFERFLAATAPRLAAALRTGEECPVCGSPEHPRPATSELDHGDVSVAALESLRSRAVEAGRVRNELVGERGMLVEALGADAARNTADLRAELAAVEGRRHELDAAVAGLDRLVTATDGLVATRTSAFAAATTAGAEHRAVAARAAQLRGEAGAAAAEAAQLAVSDEAAVRLLAECRQATAAADQLDSALLAAAAADAAHDGARAVLEAALEDGGWGDLTTAVTATATDREIEQLDRRVSTWDAELHALEAQLVVDDAELPNDPVDLAAREAFALAAAGDRTMAVDRHSSLEVHVGLARAAAAAVGPEESVLAMAIREAEVVATAYERCAGQLAPKVSLESWVLGAELDRVAEAANVHLAEMTAGRFRLVRMTDTTDARVSTGLDLVVDDAYTGTSRRTTSLSGGERFQASLSLALGLADVVTSGVAATARTLDSLFVDEGFGSLDAAALDQAISTLDRLRVHGRQIGVITHVEAMQAALPVGVQVERLPGDAGSRIRQLVTARASV